MDNTSRVRCRPAYTLLQPRQSSHGTAPGRNRPPSYPTQCHAPDVRRTCDLLRALARGPRRKSGDAGRNDALGGCRNFTRDKRGCLPDSAVFLVASASSSQRLGARSDRRRVSHPIVCSVAHNPFHRSQANLGVTVVDERRQNSHAQRVPPSSTHPADFSKYGARRGISSHDAHVPGIISTWHPCQNE